MGKHRSVDLKNAVLDFYLRTNNVYKASKIFQIPEETIRRWVQRYFESGNVNYHYRGSMSYKVEQQHFDHIKHILTQYKDTYLRDLKELMKNNFPNFDISLTHLSRVVKDIPYSRKLWTHRHYPKPRFGIPLNFDKDKAEFFRKLKKYHIDDMIAIDETSIQVGLDRKRARCYIGQRCTKKTDDNIIFQRFSLLVAISPKGIETCHLKKGAIVAEDIQLVVKSLLSRKKNKKLVIMDNAPSHKKGMENTIQNMAHELLYILPYTHYLNPIENFFNQLKHFIKDKVPMNEQEIKESIQYVISKIRPEQLKRYFLNAYEPEQIEKTK